MLAYKGFHSDLTCTMGKRTHQYIPGKWYREEEAKCANTGFHATDNPLDVLAYYHKDDDRYFIVEMAGNIDEDAVNSRISAPEIRLVRELSRNELYHEGVLWMAIHEKAPLAKVVKHEKGNAAGDGNVVVRGMKPKAKGQIGDIIYLVKENKKGEIVEIGSYQIDGKTYHPDIYYDIRGKKVV